MHNDLTVAELIDLLTEYAGNEYVEIGGKQQDIEIFQDEESGNIRIE